MTYHGIPGDRKQLGIQPTPDDHKFVRSLSVMGIGVRQICVALGERYNLVKPMSRQTLYWHFRKDLIKKRRGRKPSRVTLARRWENNITGGMRDMIAEINDRRRLKREEKAKKRGR